MQSKNAWAKLRRSSITIINIPIIYRLIISHSDIGSILLYSLHTVTLNKTNLSTMQSFYPTCIREIVHGKRQYDPNHQRNTSKQIRIGNNISNIQSRLSYMQIKTYYTWGSTQSISYANKQNIINTISNFPTHIQDLENFPIHLENTIMFL